MMAVNRVKESGKSVAGVARELDLSPNTLHGWINKFGKHGGNLTNRDYQRINSVDSVQATRELGDMVKRAGVLVQNGTRGGAYYTFSEMVLEKQQAEFFSAPLLKDNEAMVIDYIKRNGFITNSLRRELLGLENKDATNYILTNMFKKDLMKRTGKGKGTKYTL